jgi:hypothetical protein
LLGERPLLATALALALALAALLRFEPPRELALGAYLRQLRARLVEIRGDYDSALRRRSTTSPNKGAAP